MIVGNGIDIAEVPRIRQSIERFGSRFLERIFTQSEMHCCDSKANSVARYAARFAAKEAAMKALGTAGTRVCVGGIVRSCGSPAGVRRCIFTAKLGVKNTSLSISHTEEQAIAQVILEN